MRLHTLTGALALAGLLSACSMAPKYETPLAPVATNWAVPAGVRTPGNEVALPIRWQQFFHHAQLREVIQFTLDNNRDLRAAALNVQAFQALYRIQKSQNLPSVGVQGSGARQRVPADLAAAPRAVVSGNYSVGLGIAAYELDLFGRVSSLNEQALQQYLSMDSTHKATQLSLVAAAANAWMTWQADLQMLEVVTRTLAANEQALELVVSQVENGIATELQRYQAQTAVDSARAQHAQFTRTVEQDLNALQVLVGTELPASVRSARALPQDWQLADLPVGLPSQVLAQRPDILAAEQQLRAANANIGAARAAFFPSISLTASAGTSSRELSGLFEGGSGAWSFAPQINIPLFSAGRLSANLDYATLQKDLRVAQYEKSIQDAFREVSDGLSAQRTYELQVDANQQLVQTSTKYLDLAQLRYQSGVDSYLTVIDAQRTLLSSELQAIQVSLQQALSEVQLFKALGGGVLSGSDSGKS
ncbi:efflux transporter outer membrane subunit [Acidovorax sp. JG5]|uniref:efflux transporter outer membrane subunit n=1 Tax=Acidovorax sp. JG5 TaxID=2822718 RepID=UPI001B33423A|nr:efflux transporter outer membrane subunit [Acidovorax sp. JG5]MBP3982642.1 efflux transporter outer membrane subunit [Acidovorax sp. JG5]